MARSQLLALLALLLLAASARQAPAAVTPAATQLTQAVEVDNNAPQAAALPPGTPLLEALHNASGSAQVNAVVSGSTVSVSATISPLTPVDGGSLSYVLFLPNDITDCTISKTKVTVQWVKCEGSFDGNSCSSPGNAFSSQIQFDLQTQGNAGIANARLVQQLAGNPTYGIGPSPGQSFTVTFDDQAATVVGRNPDGTIANGGNPTSGTFRPFGVLAGAGLSLYNNLDARGRRFVLFVREGQFVANIPGNPLYLQSWQIEATCAQPVVVGEPPCEQGNFIGPGANFWGPKTKPGTNTLVTQADPAIGGWPDECAKTFDACQAETTDPAVFDTTCGCALWACLNPCIGKTCPATGEAPICPPQGLRAYYCNKLKDANAICGSNVPAVPNDCDSLGSATAAAVSKRVRRNRN